MKISPQTKSFIILVIIAIVGTYLCLSLWVGLIDQGNSFQSANEYAPSKTISYTPSPTPVSQQVKTVDTSGWKTYSNKEFGFSFKYNPAWKVLAPKTVGAYTVFQIDPGAKYYNIKIYVGKNDYYVMGGLPTTNETIGGAPALNVNNELYGIKNNGIYYTFDIGWSMSLVPEFDAMVHSVTFGS